MDHSSPGCSDQDPPSEQPFTRFCPAFFLSAPVLHQTLWLVVFVLGAVIFCYLSRRRKKLSQAKDPWEDVDRLDSILVLAVDQNATIQLRSSAGSFPITAVCAGLTEKNLAIQVIRPREDFRDWIGREVSAFFHIDSGGKMLFYSFETLVIKHSGDEKCPILETLRPTRLCPADRRSCPRLTLSRPSVLALGIWPGPAGAPRTLPSTPAALPEPIFVFRPPHVENAHLANISSTGLAIRISRKKADTMPETCLIFICLDKRRGKSLNLWLACSRRHMIAVSGRNAAITGFQFTAWARVFSAEADIAWAPCEDKREIAPLGSWILRQRAFERHARFSYVNLLTKE